MPDALTVITTHVNADFDAIASLLAAQKLYPEAKVIFPGSQEKNLRNFFINSMAYLFNMIELKDVDLDNIGRLVIVDTRQAQRIGPLAEVLNRPGVEIHAYDHHPPTDTDIVPHFGIHRRTGATVTILTKELRKRQIAISSDEATIMCLGIYEDTGSFTFSSTTEEDFLAAAFLLSCGANLNDVANLISREVNPEQIALLNDMIQAATRCSVNGVEVVVTSVSTEGYVPDFAFLVHQLVKMENLDAIFALARMGNKIYVVARSRIPEVDVGSILTPLGGGGHSYAASATVREQTLVQTEHRLIDILHRSIRPRRRAQDLMSTPPIAVEDHVTCTAAAELLTRYNINALLVVGAGDRPLKGYITRQVIEKAMYHKLGHAAVAEYMNTEFAVVGLEAGLEEIQEKIIGNKQRILPVMDDDRICGVVTRTDLLNILVRQNRNSRDQENDPADGIFQARTRNVLKFMEERISAELLARLRSIGEAAKEIGCSAYVVGGFVRDLFLYRPNEDMDIVIEGDGIAFARKYAKMSGARIHTHEKFGTAVIIFPDGFKIDVASARMEYYRFPAALPIVEMSSIKLDLSRRDFTINTLAIQLNPGRFGTLIDFFAAHKDLKAKALRVLHNLSFVEDPTRVFRAIRFEQRFDFTIGKLTSGLIENAVRMDFFKQLSGRRVFTEIRLILEEDNPSRSIIRLNDYHLLGVIHPGIEMNKDLEALFNATKKVLSWYDLLFLEESYLRWAVYFMILIRHCNRKTSQAICERFELAPRYRRLICDMRFDADRCLYWLERHTPMDRGQMYRQLAEFKTEPILYMMAVTRKKRVKQAISRYFTQLRFVRPQLDGKALLDMGLAPGPVFRKILDAILDAKLNGSLETLAEEMEFARSFAAEAAKAGASQKPEIPGDD
ncbi:MAG: CBS domain-containing protein [Desulfobacterales bacterium]|nr:CBS domain-containing protein [Desulfobacterales bacterium]